MIEDEPAIAASIAARLDSEGFQVETAADGLAGVDLCRRFRPDLVVLDLMLPGLDGLSVCREIQRERQVPVLMTLFTSSKDCTWVNELQVSGVGTIDLAKQVIQVAAYSGCAPPVIAEPRLRQRLLTCGDPYETERI